jgi:DNA-binding response OmpR family regulator
MLRNNLLKYRDYIETVRSVGYKFNERALSWYGNKNWQK